MRKAKEKPKRKPLVVWGVVSRVSDDLVATAATRSLAEHIKRIRVLTWRECKAERVVRFVEAPDAL